MCMCVCVYVCVCYVCICVYVYVRKWRIRDDLGLMCAAAECCSVFQCATVQLQCGCSVLQCGLQMFLQQGSLFPALHLVTTKKGNGVSFDQRRGLVSILPCTRINKTQ